MSKFLFLFIIFVILSISEINCVIFTTKVKPGNNYCIGEYLTEDTVAIFAMTTDLKNIIITLNDPKGKSLYFKKYQQDVRVSLTATESGNYEMCIKNNDRSEGKINFEF